MLTSEVFSGFPQLLLFVAFPLKSTVVHYNFFCNVLPSEALSGSLQLLQCAAFEVFPTAFSGVVCLPLMSSMVPHSLVCSVLSFEVLSSSSQPLLQCAAL